MTMMMMMRVAGVQDPSNQSLSVHPKHVDGRSCEASQAVNISGASEQNGVKVEKMRTS